MGEFVEALPVRDGVNEDVAVSPLDVVLQDGPTTLKHTTCGPCQ